MLAPQMRRGSLLKTGCKERTYHQKVVVINNASTLDGQSV